LAVTGRVAVGQARISAVGVALAGRTAKAELTNATAPTIYILGAEAYAEPALAEKTSGTVGVRRAGAVAIRALLTRRAGSGGAGLAERVIAAERKGVGREAAAEEDCPVPVGDRRGCAGTHGHGIIDQIEAVGVARASRPAEADAAGRWRRAIGVRAASATAAVGMAGEQVRTITVVTAGAAATVGVTDTAGTESAG
jgi:hypothetical protein